MKNSLTWEMFHDDCLDWKPVPGKDTFYQSQAIQYFTPQQGYFLMKNGTYIFVSMHGTVASVPLDIWENMPLFYAPPVKHHTFLPTDHYIL